MGTAVLNHGNTNTLLAVFIQLHEREWGWRAQNPPGANQTSSIAGPPGVSPPPPPFPALKEAHSCRSKQACTLYGIDAPVA